MSRCQVHDVDVISDSSSVRRVVVGAKNCYVRFFTEGDLDKNYILEY